MKSIRIIVFIAALVITLGVLWYTDNRNYYRPSETDTFNISVGEKFEFKLDENGSAQSVNCFIGRMDCVKLTTKKFRPNSTDDGAGGITTYTFEAVAKGTDTLRVKDCPILPGNTAKDGELDNIFVVNVRN